MTWPRWRLSVDERGRRAERIEGRAHRPNGAPGGAAGEIAASRPRTSAACAAGAASAASEVILVYSDGASRGNPGPAGVGAVLADEGGGVISEISEGIGTATNNEAEYIALLRGLELARRLGARRVRSYTDSELLARQLGGEYAIKSERLRPLAARAQRLGREFESWDIAHIRREMNSRADELANRAIDASARANAQAAGREAKSSVAAPDARDGE